MGKLLRTRIRGRSDGSGLKKGSGRTNRAIKVINPTNSTFLLVINICSQDGLGIIRVRSGNWGASLGSLLPLLSSAKEHSQTRPPGLRMWHVQSDTWTSQWCKICHTSLSQRVAFSHRPSTSRKLKDEPVKRDDTLVAPDRGCSRLSQKFSRIDITTRQLVLTSGASGVTEELSCSTQGGVYLRHAGLGRALAVRQHIRQGHF